MSSTHAAARRPPAKVPAWMVLLALAGGAGVGWGFWRVTRWDDWSVTAQWVVSGVIGLVAGFMVFATLGIARWLRLGGRDMSP